MLFQAVCLAALVAFQFANCAPLQDEKIEPVKLSHFCIRTQKVGEEHNKSAIVLIHGILANAHHWDGVWEVLALKTGRRVCAVDLRNHGGSAWNDRTDVEANAVDIGNFLDSQNIHKVNLIGHSLGGKISVHYALKNPDRVNSVVVEDMRPNGATEDAKKTVSMVFKLLQEALKTVPEGSDEDQARKIIVDYLNAKLKELNINITIDETAAKIIELRCNDGKCQYKMNIDVLEKASANAEEILTQSSGSFHGPALFIYGKESEFKVGEDKEMILEHFPNAKLVGVEGAGHQIHGLFPEFNDEVVRFLNNLKN